MVNFTFYLFIAAGADNPTRLETKTKQTNKLANKQGVVLTTVVTFSDNSPKCSLINGKH